MPDLKEVAAQIAQPMLSKDYPVPPIPEQAIDKVVAEIRGLAMFESLGESDWSTVAKMIKSTVKITMEPGTTLKAATVVDWLTDREGDIAWKRWIAYRQLLTQKGFAPGVLATIDTSTRDILNCVGDPETTGQWKRRGLVIGEVQSGKTASYLGVVNRAADAGYRLIILLAGGTEALRKQTQFRVDEGLLGRDTAQSGKHFGVAKWHTNFLSAQALTTQESDFRKKSKEASDIQVDPDSPTPLVFVVKKNKTALENLKEWISGQRLGEARLDIPMLFVDDESDYASVNTRDEDSPTVINSLIREILDQVTRSSYLAFTATPFANVFIDHESDSETLGDDLFPKDYIRTLDAPSNYVGSRRYFGSEDKADSSLLVALDDVTHQFPFKHKSHHSVGSLPKSLKDAIRAFVVASAIREARSDRQPRSMLVNVSRFKLVQRQVHELVEAEFERVKSAVELHSVGYADDEHAEMRELRRIFQLHFGSAEEPWSKIRRNLKAAVQDTSVKLINSERVKVAKDLTEVETSRMIAVGGDVLSRGLTLEGLTVSYFHRQVGAADTLLQMARWFGYRPAYDDVCRVWIPDEVSDRFRYVAGIVEDLRAQLKVMKKQQLTPTHFGLRVRMHPEALLITARNKMKAAQAKPWTVNVAGARNLETVRVSAENRDIVENYRAVKDLVAAVEQENPNADWSEGIGSIRGVSGVDRQIVAAFLERYVAFAGDPLFADSALAQFVRTTSNPKFAKWTVAFVPGKGDQLKLSNSLTFSRTERGVGSTSPIEIGSKQIVGLRVSGASSRVAGSNDVARAGSVGDGKQTEPDVYENLGGPVLLVYAMHVTAKAVGKSKTPDKTAEGLIRSSRSGKELPVTAIKVAIPGVPGDKGADVKYMLNSVALTSWTGASVEDVPDDEDEVDGVEQDA